jgi:xylan 1,4-beta-xylosidase
MKTYLIPLITAFVIASCGVKNKPAATDTSTTGQLVELFNPALPGDNPDPSVIRVGDVYYATSTTNEWAPYFTIYRSTDLKNWELINHVFPNGFKDMKDEWGENNFWASELAYDPEQNRIYAYYTAHNRLVEGNPGLQCGIAWIDADEIESGTFTDNGPVIIEDDCGAIDAFEFQDKGKIYVFWKNDGNGCGKESWIWMQEINEDRTQLLGEKRKMYTNSQPWENALVEGASFFRQGDYIYSLYSVGGCCDANCDYKTGIARTRSLEDPVWEKYEKNPIMVSNENWRCPGHGTVVESPEGRLFMMYHAFNKDYDVFVGREGVIEELITNEDGWPVLHNSTVANRPVSSLDVRHDFTRAKKLPLEWQWPSKSERPAYSLRKGLQLQASREQNKGLGVFLGQFIKSVHFDAVASVQVTDAEAGVALGGAFAGSKWPGELGAIGLSASSRGIRVFNTFSGRHELIKADERSLSGKVDLRLQVREGGKRLQMQYREGNGDWIEFYADSFDASKFVPWGMGYRIGIVARGAATEAANFQSFEMTNR